MAKNLLSLYPKLTNKEKEWLDQHEVRLHYKERLLLTSRLELAGFLKSRFPWSKINDAYLPTLINKLESNT